MSHRTLCIAIIGAGIGGLTAASLLSKNGHRVTVFERTAATNTVGAGLLLQPTGMRVLSELGILDRVVRLGAPVGRLLGTTVSRRTVLDLSYHDLVQGLAGLGVHRAMLHSELLECALEAGATIRKGCGVREIETSRDVRTLWMDSGEAEGPFDIVVICDGARSSLRRFAGTVRRELRYPWGALWFVGSRPPDSLGSTLRQVYDGAHTMLGFLPSGRLSVASPSLVSMFWSIRAADWNGPGGFAFSEWKRKCNELLPEAGPVLAQIRSADDLIYAPYYDVRLVQEDDRTVAIGDSAHATSPQLGQGANLAMLDAASLARCIAAHANVGDAIGAHVRSRRSQIRYYQAASRWLTPVFQSDRKTLAMGRDALLGSLCRFPPTRRQMLKTLAGCKNGFIH